MAELEQARLSQLRESPFNPRQAFDGLEELAASIKANGVIQPLIVRQVKGAAGLEIVAGARRFRAAKLAKLDSVPVLVRELSDDAARVEQILENLQREGISPLEEAAAFQELLKASNTGKDGDEKIGVEDIADQVGRSKRYVYARLELLKLAPPVQKALAAGKIEASHAQELVPLKPEQQKEILGSIESEAKYGQQMSVQAIRNEIEQRYAPKPAAPKLSAKEKARREREAAAQKQREAAEAERELRKHVAARAAVALWAKLRKATKADRAWLLRIQLELVAQSQGAEISEALFIAAGKPIPNQGYVQFPHREKAIARAAATGELLPLVALANVLDMAEYRPKWCAPIYRRFGVNPKAITQQLVAERKAKSKVQTSAKPGAPGKAKRGRKARR